jgi:hypothetical protein
VEAALPSLPHVCFHHRQLTRPAVVEGTRVRETIVVTPDGIRAVAGDVRRLAGELREAAAALGGGACQVAAALAATPCGFDACGCQKVGHGC